MKTRKQTIIATLIILALYNVVAFLMPAIKNTNFWVAYVFSNLSIIIASLVIMGALDKDEIKEKVKGLPVASIAWGYLALQIILGFVETYYIMNYRYSILINTVLLGIVVIILVSSNAAKKEIDRVEQKVQEKVFFIKDLQADVELYAEKVTDAQAKKEVEELAETIRYSDPMSHSQLASIENQINNKVQSLKQVEDNSLQIKQICKELQGLLAERNKKAKIYKNQPEATDDTQKPLNFKMIIAVIVTIIVLIILGIVFYFTVMIPNKKYDEAMRLYTNNQYLQAKEAFAELGDYKDSEVKQKQIMYDYAIELWNKKDYSKAEKEFDKLGEYSDSKDKKNEVIYQNATELLEKKEYSKAAKEFSKLGDYKDAKAKVLEINNLFGEKDVIYLGTYKGNPIAWQVLETKGSKALLITRNTIDEMAYHTEFKAIEWKDASIREWLNGEFYNSFDEKEKARIIKTGKDNVFLLSDKEVKKYEELKNAKTSWWLKTNGEEKTKSMYVSSNGTINKEGDIVTKLHGVRPAIWLDLEKGE